MADMNLNDINKWWHRGIDKERKRLTNAPKPFKNDPFSVPTDFSNFAPEHLRPKRRKAR